MSACLSSILFCSPMARPNCVHLISLSVSVYLCVLFAAFSVSFLFLDLIKLLMELEFKDTFTEWN